MAKGGCSESEMCSISYMGQPYLWSCVEGPLRKGFDLQRAEIHDAMEILRREHGNDDMDTLGGTGTRNGINEDPPPPPPLGNGAEEPMGGTTFNDTTCNGARGSTESKHKALRT